MRPFAQVIIVYKLLILAYLIGQDPVATQQTFQMQREFMTMEECKTELLSKDVGRGTYNVMWDFVNNMNFDYDWLAAGCRNEETGEEFIIKPTYPKGKPNELDGLDFDREPAIQL